MIKKVRAFLLYCIYLVLIISIVLEVVLRVFNPIPVRLKGDQISLPINQDYSFTNEYDCFDSLIVHRKNSLGFRGPELNEDAEETKIIAVGGSTTECFFVSDDKVWTKVLHDSLNKNSTKPFWVNNAGLNGHSTFGHHILVKDIIAPLKPDYAMFLIGINDMDRADLNDFDKRYLNDQKVQERGSSWIRNTFLSLSKKSELINLAYNISKAIKAQEQQIFVDKVIRLEPSDTLSLGRNVVEAALGAQQPLLSSFEGRVDSLVLTCKENGIEPILITQPLLYGEGIDPVTGTDLKKAQVYEGVNGDLYWKKLSLYNNKTIAVAKKHGIALIDLASLMPKSNTYFYDAMHYTNKGSIKIGDLVYQELQEIIRER